MHCTTGAQRSGHVPYTVFCFRIWQHCLLVPGDLFYVKQSLPFTPQHTPAQVMYSWGVLSLAGANRKKRSPNCAPVLCLSAMIKLKTRQNLTFPRNNVFWKGPLIFNLRCRLHMSFITLEGHLHTCLRGYAIHQRTNVTQVTSNES